MTRATLPPPALAPTLAIAIAIAFALGGCGRVGTLDQPAPLYGAKAKAEYRARKAAAAAAAKAARDDGDAQPLAPDTPPPPGSAASRGPQSLRDQPGEGMRAMPNGPAPSGALPDPYTHPQ